MNLRYYHCDIEIIDPDVVYRLVGFYEYRHALSHLDVVIAKSTQEERKSIDQLINERLGYQIMMLTGVDGGKKIRHEGLAWMTALARVELGAMLAALTSTANPFEQFAPTPVDRSQYLALMTEGYQIHWNYMKTDRTLFPKPVSATAHVVLIQDQHLQMLQHWSDAMIKLLAGNPIVGKQLALEREAINKIKEDLSKNFASRVARQTGNILTITEGPKNDK